MKSPLILSYAIFFIGISTVFKGQVVFAQNSSCPKIDESDILRIHSFLTSQEFKTKRKEANIKQYSFNLSELERQHTEVFRSYWEKRGVHNVTDPKLCQKITNALGANKKNKSYTKKYNRIYYKVEDHYVILYRTKQKRKNIKKGELPVQILDENFNIISDYKI